MVILRVNKLRYQALSKQSVDGVACLPASIGVTKDTEMQVTDLLQLNLSYSK